MRGRGQGVDVFLERFGGRRVEHFQHDARAQAEAVDKCISMFKKYFSYISNEFYYYFFLFRTILLILSPKSHIITITQMKEDLVMVVTATEFKANFGKYLELIAKEDIFITRNGKTVAKVVNPQVSAVDSLRGMLGGVSSDIDMDSLREERLLKYENNV